MGFLPRHINTVLSALTGMAMLMVAGACSDTEAPVPAPPADGPVVTLSLSVGINSPQQMRDSRAAGEYPSGYPYDFEPAATVWEGINTLRIIIVRPDNSVEGNRMWNFSDLIPAEGNLYGAFEFPVKSAENKRVYLIANEASIAPSVDWTQYAIGSPLAPATAERMMQSQQWPLAVADSLATPYIDNTGDASAKKYVPMSEFFDTYIDAPAQGATTTTQKATYFITRGVVKFGFSIASQNAQGVTNVPVNSFRVKSLVFRNVMQKAYVFPYETVYIPSKSDNTLDFRRVIAQFTTPGLNGNLVRPYHFPVDNIGFGVNASGSNYASTQVYMPELYFNETMNNTDGNRFDIDVEVEFEGMEGSVKYYRLEMPNLPNFPRNTFVKVNFTMKENDLSAQVDVVPYIGVELKPIFGFTQINPKDPQNQQP